MRGSDAEGTLITANFTGQRQPLTDTSIVSTLLRHPLLTAKVLGGIHWEALKMVLKGLRLRPLPAPPAAAVTVVRGATIVEDEQSFTPTGIVAHQSN